MYQGFPIVLRGREEAKAGTARSKAELHDAASQSAMWVPASLPSPGDVTGKRDPCMNHYAPQKKTPHGTREGGSSLKATSPDKRGSHTKLTLETSNREISWAPRGRREKENKSAIRTGVGSSPHQKGLPAHLHVPTSVCSILCPPSLSSCPGARSGTKPFPQQRGTRSVSRLAKTLQG